MGLKEFCIAIR